MGGKFSALDRSSSNIKVKIVSGTSRKEIQNKVLQKKTSKGISQGALNFISNMNIESISQLQAYHRRRLVGSNEESLPEFDTGVCKTIKCDINLHKSSLRLHKIDGDPYKYNLSFTFDSLYA